MRDSYAPLRLKRARDAAGVGRRPIGLGTTGQPSFVGRVFAASKLPTSTGVYYSVHPVAVLGVEGEGNVPSLTPDATSVVLVCILGSTAPAPGDDLVCRFEGNRWVAERTTHASGPPPGAMIPGCACASVPVTLQLSSSGPCAAGDFYACTLQYGPTPAVFSGLNLGANCFLSTQTFADNTTGRLYYYNLACSGLLFRLSRVFLPSPPSGPYHDQTIYTWLVGLPGNACAPFLLSSGQIYPGGDPNCLVIISQ